MFRKLGLLGIGVSSGLIVVVALIVALSYSLKDRERRYEGATIDEWLERLNTGPKGEAEANRRVLEEKVIPVLCHDLSSDTNDWRLKIWLVNHLNLLPGINIYAAESFERRAAAAKSLARLGKFANSAAPDLVRCIKGQDDYPRASAVEAFGSMRIDPSVDIPLLIECLTDRNNDVIAKAAEALGNYGNQAAAALPSLTPLLTGPSKEIRYEAKKAIHLIDDSR
jgi:hypothetical protein